MQVSKTLDSIFGVPKTLGSIFGGQQGNSGMDPPPPVLKNREYPLGFETGLSDCHGLVMTLMKAVVARLKPKIIRYRGYKRFDPKKFLQDVKKAPFVYHMNNPDKTYDNMTSSYFPKFG